MFYFAIAGHQIASEYILLALCLVSILVSVYRKKIPSISAAHPVSLIVTLLNVGRFPILSGTMGTLFSVYWLVYFALLPRLEIMQPTTMLSLLFVGTCIIYAVGVWASKIYLEKTGREDPKEIVIDEMVGVYLAVCLSAAFYSIMLTIDHDPFFFGLMLSPYYLIALFILFRIYDMAKPWHVGWCDRNIKGAHGVMLDDVVAGIYAAITFFVLLLVLHYSGGMLWVFKTFYPDWIGKPAPHKVF